jgi:hypothetical protein
MSKKVVNMSLQSVQFFTRPLLNILSLKFKVKEIIKEGKIQISDITNADKFMEKSDSPSFVNEYVRTERKGKRVRQAILRCR